MVCRTDRLGHLCVALNLTPAAFAHHLDLSLRRAKRVLKPSRVPSLKLMARVHRAFPHLNPLWLLCGEGEMFSPRPAAGEPPNAGNSVGVNYGVLHQTIYYGGSGLPLC